LGHDPQEPLQDPAATTLWHHAQALRPDAEADHQAAREALGNFLTAELARLSRLRAELWTEQDEPAASDVADRAGVEVSDKATRLHRYEVSNEMILHRNVNKLVQLRKSETEEQAHERS